MSIVRTVIVDDERLAREKIRSMLAAHRDIVIVAECEDGLEAVAEVRRHRPDLVFLDVQMPDCDGFDVLRRLKGAPVPAVIFTTAHDQYAIQAFQVEAIDYLLKPFDRRRFNEALRRALRRIDGAALPEARDRLLAAMAQVTAQEGEAGRWTRFVVRTRDRLVLIPSADIDWIEADGRYVRLHCGAANHLAREPIAEVERRLDSREFARIHRGAIVNLKRVSEIFRGFNGDYLARLVTGKTLPVSRRYWARIRHLGGMK